MGVAGNSGTLLIDPSDVTIFNTGDTSGTVPGGTTGAGSVADIRPDHGHVVHPSIPISTMPWSTGQ